MSVIPMMVRVLVSAASLVVMISAHADEQMALLEEHCLDCHNPEKAKGKFELSHLGERPKESNLDLWLDALDYVATGEMPPEDDTDITEKERAQILSYFETKVEAFDTPVERAPYAPRRMNNREFANSVADVLLIEDVGTHLPMDNLIADALYHGFDTHSNTLGFSKFHLEQYIEAARKVVDATILSGEQPEAAVYEIPAEKIGRQQLSQNSTRPIQWGENGVFQLKVPGFYAYLGDFAVVPETGSYRLSLQASAKGRQVYPADRTGVYHDDPIEIEVKLGDRLTRQVLPDGKVADVSIEGWLAKGTRPQFLYPTDGLRMQGNGNFKFQHRIVPDYLKKHDPEAYQARVDEILATSKKEKHKANPDSWHNWVDQWDGPRVELYGARIEGPLYESWPPRKQVALIGQDPTVEDAVRILKPIVERAWRRNVEDDELDEFVALVSGYAEESDDVIEAYKEGIVAILASPGFLLLGQDSHKPEDRFAEKLSFLLQSRPPSADLQLAAQVGDLDDFGAVLAHLKTWRRSLLAEGASPFVEEFPRAWLELNDINFMAPDPERFRFYHKKRLSEDMVDEVFAFFRHAVVENRPLPEFLSADYSFVNADLAQIYGLDDVPQDSVLRKYHFKDNHRGGFLGMGAFLTSTADSLGTSPIHRAVYVMENLLGIHPTPPPADVVITEPDVREAKTIKEILNAHIADETCASCHEGIDPYGYAFENFGPTGEWRDHYAIPKDQKREKSAKRELEREDGIVDTKMEDLWDKSGIPIDASARFRSGFEYENISGFREFLQTEANQQRFVRCFINKVLTYANGEVPGSVERRAISDILEVSAEHDYRILETLAATIDSPLFRN